jgi:hypothetical protein
MSPVFEATLPQSSLTTSHYYNEWLGFLDGAVTMKNRQVHFPDLSICVAERPNGNWVLVNGETSVSGKSIEQLTSDIIDDVESPVMPARNQFTVNLIIERIEKGSPSFCDEVEQ